MNVCFSRDFDTVRADVINITYKNWSHYSIVSTPVVDESAYIFIKGPKSKLFVEYVLLNRNNNLIICLDWKGQIKINPNYSDIFVYAKFGKQNLK